MDSITHTTRKKNLTDKAKQLVKDARILNLAKMANILIEIFGIEETFQQITKREGQEIEMYFPSVDGYLSFTLVRDKKNFEARAERAKNPVATITINLPKEKDIAFLNKIIRSKNNLFSLLKLLPKILLGKLKIKGSYLAAIALCRCMMIGNHPSYQRNIEMRY